MLGYVLKKDRIGKLVQILSRNTLYAVVERDGVTTFEKVEKAEDIKFDYQNSDVPPKKILLPQTETTFKYTLGKDQKIEMPEEKGKNIILGIRPCDARSFSILDKVFEKDFLDIYYSEKRENTTLIGLSCNEPGINCFCTSLDGGVGDKEGLDMLLTALGDEYFVEVTTDKGKAIIENSSDLFSDASDEHAKKKDEINKRAESLMKRRISVEGIEEKLDKIFDDDLWNEVSMKCIGCSVCTYLCPTCHCFDIQDEATLREGRRIRVWDSCSNPEYTLQASGYNPRPARINRVRNRIYHKYEYYPKNFKVIACVGCGRCIDKCSVNMNIVEVLSRVKEI